MNELRLRTKQQQQKSVSKHFTNAILGGDDKLFAIVSPVSVSLGESILTFTVTLILNTIELNCIYDKMRLADVDFPLEIETPDTPRNNQKKNQSNHHNRFCYVE